MAVAPPGSINVNEYRSGAISLRHLGAGHPGTVTVGGGGTDSLTLGGVDSLGGTDSLGGVSPQ